MEECGVARIISTQLYINSMLKETSAYLWAYTIYIMPQEKKVNTESETYIALVLK
jgi:hypothetical protein